MKEKEFREKRKPHYEETRLYFGGGKIMMGIAGAVFIAIGAMLLAKWIKG